MNCGHPFTGHEKYCPECGQKNKGSKITFSSFLKEVFNGFISLDAKVWTTLVPLLIKPGKVSRDFIEGKRARYSNPFQFYLTVSILFFIMLGLVDRYQEFKELSEGKTEKTVNLSDLENEVKKNPDSIINSITQDFSKEIKNLEKVPGLQNIQKQGLDSLTIKKVSDSIKSNIKKKANQKDDDFDIAINGDTDNVINKMVKYQKEHPDIPMDDALDSLKLKKELWNRFLYTKAKKINSFMSDTYEGQKEFIREMISYASVSIFILLPIFTLFLKFVYIRRKFTYVEHLIFVFHTQTVFFILLTIFFLAGLASGSENVAWIFSILFLIYLFIALKNFYKQGFFKTFFKFLILNFAYMLFASVGFLILLLVTFASY